MSERYKSTSQLSELTGLDRATVKKKLDLIKPHSAKANLKLYDARLALPLLVTPVTHDKESKNQKLLDEQLRYESGRADKIELEVQLKRGELVHIEDVGKAVDKEYSRVKASLNALPSKLAKPISMVTDPAKCKELLDEATNEVLAHLTLDAEVELSRDADEPTETTPEEPDISTEASAETQPS